VVGTLSARRPTLGGRRQQARYCTATINALNRVRYTCTTTRELTLIAT
jgi:hypothetical protein